MARPSREKSMDMELESVAVEVRSPGGWVLASLMSPGANNPCEPAAVTKRPSAEKTALIDCSVAGGGLAAHRAGPAVGCCLLETSHRVIRESAVDTASFFPSGEKASAYTSRPATTGIEVTGSAARSVSEKPLPSL